ncbi:MAG TPA: hypothetical protein PLD37_00330 [Usitatibacteraceae bacterium]|nr:hypothetical protein [Usitatibacteraceae bacterium]
MERGQLARHRAERSELERHRQVASDFAMAARLPGIPDSVRFSNLYDAAHAIALAGLKLAGYRAREGEGNRQLTLSCIEQTLALRKGSAATLVEANRLRSLMQYQGSDVDVPDHLLAGLQVAIDEGLAELATRLRSISPPPPSAAPPPPAASS